MEEIYFKWTTREEKSRYSKEVKYTLIVLFIFLILLAAINKNFTVIPLILIAAVTIFISLRRSAQCIDYSLTNKGVEVCDTTYSWNTIGSYNIIDDPDIKGRLILETKGFSGRVVVPVYDDDFGAIEKIFKRRKISKNNELAPSFMDTLSRLF